MVKFLKAVWKFLDGNKTIIGLFLLLLLHRIPGMREWLGRDYGIVQMIIQLLTGLSAAHHVKKGYFKPSKK